MAVVLKLSVHIICNCPYNFAPITTALLNAKLEYFLKYQNIKIHSTKVKSHLMFTKNSKQIKHDVII
jgi:hypothetical protein